MGLTLLLSRFQRAFFAIHSQVGRLVFLIGRWNSLWLSLWHSSRVIRESLQSLLKFREGFQNCSKQQVCTSQQCSTLKTDQPQRSKIWARTWCREKHWNTLKKLFTKFWFKTGSNKDENMEGSLKKFVCSNCLRTFPTKWQLNRHMEICDFNDRVKLALSSSITFQDSAHVILGENYARPHTQTSPEKPEIQDEVAFNIIEMEEIRSKMDK